MLVSLPACYSLGSVGEGFIYCSVSIWMQIEATSLSFHIAIHHCLINCSFCSCLHTVENFWDSSNPSSLSLIALDAQGALLSSPLERHFVWCGFKVDPEHRHTYARTPLKKYTQTNVQKASKRADKCAQANWQTPRQISPALWGKKKRQIGRSAFSLTPCIHLPFLPLSQPTQYTYTRALKSSSHRRIQLTHFMPLFCPLVCCNSFCDELDTVKDIFFFKQNKKIPAVDNCQVLCSSHHKTNTTSVLIIQPNLPHSVQEKAGKTSYFHRSLCTFPPCSFLSASQLVHPWILLLKLSHRLHHMHLFQ